MRVEGLEAGTGTADEHEYIKKTNNKRSQKHAGLPFVLELLRKSYREYLQMLNTLGRQPYLENAALEVTENFLVPLSYHLLAATATTTGRKVLNSQKAITRSSYRDGSKKGQFFKSHGHLKLLALNKSPVINTNSEKGSQQSAGQ